MSIWESIVKWFVKYAWPLIKKFLIIILQDLLEWLRDTINDLLNRRGKKQAEYAEDEARKAESMASNASDNKESENYKRIAQVWREVAEYLRMENEDLKNENARVTIKGQ